MQVSFAGILWILFFIVIIIAIILFNKWRQGAVIDIKSIRELVFNIKNIKNIRKKPINDGTIPCINVYEDKIVLENMLERSTDKNADSWEIGNKKYLLQGVIDNKYIRITLPSEVAYPTERLARLMGCEPLRKLKSLKFGKWEHAAPFAPVVAIIIIGLLWVVLL